VGVGAAEPVAVAPEVGVALALGESPVGVEVSVAGADVPAAVDPAELALPPVAGPGLLLAGPEDAGAGGVGVVGCLTVAPPNEVPDPCLP
jgi:hypothetical protein